MLVPRGAARRRRAGRAAHDRREGADPALARCRSACPGRARIGRARTTATATARVVLGAGPVGLLGAMALRARGLRDDRVLARAGAEPEGRLVAEPIGAHYVSSQDVAGRAARGAASATSTSSTRRPAPRALAFEVMQVLGTNGVFVFTGVPGRKAPDRGRHRSPDAEPRAEEPGRVRHRERRPRRLRGRDRATSATFLTALARRARAP